MGVEWVDYTDGGRGVTRRAKYNSDTGTYNETTYNTLPMGFPPPPSSKGTALLEIGSAEPVGWLRDSDGVFTLNPKYRPAAEMPIDEKFDRWIAATTDQTFGEWAYPQRTEFPPSEAIPERPVPPPLRYLREGVQYNDDGSERRSWLRRLLFGKYGGSTRSTGPR